MQSSLIPERPLIISPTLAATIGLEEAVMLHVFSELLSTRQVRVKSRLRWIRIAENELPILFPFWAMIDIKRVQKSLQDLGLIVLDAQTGDDSSCFYAINQQLGEVENMPAAEVPALRQSAASGRPRDGGGAGFIPADWQPGPEWVQMCRQQGVPEDFVHAQVPGFVMYWRERGQSRFSWGNAFQKHVLKEWRQTQTRQGAAINEEAMSAQWWPSEEAVSILSNAGINEAFIEDAVPEFVLYWRERGVAYGAWNSRFIDHIRRQWSKYSASLENDGLPRPIAEDWQPSAECFDILRLAEIDEDFARSKVAEFVLYWRDTGQAQASWNTRFLQFIKYNWSRQLDKLRDVSEHNAQDRSVAGQHPKSLEASFQRFTDRSWAE
ncbi:MAG: DnaT-like ssDNA-binding domain-containing protein [Pseudomonadales bacterium]|nr:DnaT-like ssDNA-binding domain-containing protein [Pseudomonadales bacterium]